MLSKVHKFQSLITGVCIAGIVISIYALSVEVKKEDDDEYEALCDISEHMSCTNVLTSRWGRGFGIIGAILGEDSTWNQPNSLFGIFVYIFLIFLNWIDSITAAKILFIFGVSANFLTVYLAYILIFILEDFCIVCVTLYGVNAILLYLSWQKKNIYITTEKKKDIVRKKQ